jgi:pimeloyl-ACP methyl ester carboxylesterase
MTEPDVRVHATAAGPIEAAVIGAGPAVVLVHGMPGSWRQAMPLAYDLADRHTVVLPSRPGYGRTPLTTGGTPSEQAAAYAALLGALDISSAAIVGISGGGPSSLAFADEHAARTTALVLCCALTGHLIEPPRGMRLAMRTPGLAPLLASLNRARARKRISDAAAVDKYLARELTPSERALLAADPAIRTDLIAFMQSHLDAPPGIEGFRNDVTQINHARATGPASAARVRAPVLVLHGDADVVIPRAHALHHAATVPGAVLKLYDDAGHVFLLTHRRDVSARVAEFLHTAEAHR